MKRWFILTLGAPVAIMALAFWVLMRTLEAIDDHLAKDFNA